MAAGGGGARGGLTLHCKYNMWEPFGCGLDSDTQSFTLFILHTFPADVPSFECHPARLSSIAVASSPPLRIHPSSFLALNGSLGASPKQTNVSKRGRAGAGWGGDGWGDRGGLVCKRLAKTRHMRHGLLVLIREPILQDKSGMEGGGREDEGGGGEGRAGRRGAAGAGPGGSL